MFIWIIRRSSFILIFDIQIFISIVFDLMFKISNVEYRE